MTELRRNSYAKTGPGSRRNAKPLPPIPAHLLFLHHHLPFQRVEDTVREKTKSPEPSRPPWMVSHSVEASWRLYICMPANSSRDRRDDSAKEVPVPTTGKEKKGQATIQTDSLRSLAHQSLPSAPLPHPTATSRNHRAPHTQVPACPEEMLVPWKPGHVSFTEATGKRGPSQSPPPLEQPGHPVGAVTHHAPSVGPIRASGESGELKPAQLSVRRRRGQRGLALLLPLRALDAAPSCGKEEIMLRREF